MTNRFTSVLQENMPPLLTKVVPADQLTCKRVHPPFVWTRSYLSAGPRDVIAGVVDDVVSADRADETLTDLLERSAHPGEIVRLVLFGRLHARPRFALAHGQVHVLDTGEVGEGALERAARAGGVGLEQARFQVLCQGKDTLVGPCVVAIQLDQLLQATAGYRRRAASRMPPPMRSAGEGSLMSSIGKVPHSGRSGCSIPERIREPT